MPEIKFELKLPNGPNSTFVIVVGGADADRDGTFEDDGEIEAFKRDGNVWTRKQILRDPITGVRFCVLFSVGQGVKWEFCIKDAADRELFKSQNTTTSNTEEIRWELP